MKIKSMVIAVTTAVSATGTALATQSWANDYTQALLSSVLS